MDVDCAVACALPLPVLESGAVTVGGAGACIWCWGVGGVVERRSGIDGSGAWLPVEAEAMGACWEVVLEVCVSDAPGLKVVG